MCSRLSVLGNGIRLAALLFVATPDADAREDLSGTVKDKTGARARRRARRDHDAAAHRRRHDDDRQIGTFTVKGLPDGQYSSTSQYPPLPNGRRGVATVGADGQTVDLVLDAVSVDEDVTVTASPGVARRSREADACR